MIRILLVDDQELFTSGLKTVIDKDAEDMEVIGSVQNGLEVMTFLETDQPDIILMDVRMPECDGVQATIKVKNKYPDIKILMLTTFDDDIYVKEALEYGAAGYLLKNIRPPELISTIRAVNQGIIMMSPKIAANLTMQIGKTEKTSPLMESPQNPPPINEECFGTFSKREYEILQLLGNGLSNTEICDHLFIADQTVRNYVSDIYAKLDVHNRTEAIKKANRLNLIVKEI